jgi:hypothetical protein
MAPKKWYAVRRGHRTGLFESWDECQAATVGFSGAVYKSFKSREDAQAWLSGSSSGAVAPAAAAAAVNPPVAGRSSGAAAGGGGSGGGGGGKVYAVARGRHVGIFESWEQVGGSTVFGVATASNTALLSVASTAQSWAWATVLHACSHAEP